MQKPPDAHPYPTSRHEMGERRWLRLLSRKTSVRSSAERRVFETAGVVSSLVSLLAFVYVPFMYGFGSPVYALLAAAMGILSLGSAFLIRKGFVNTARYILLAVCNLGSYVAVSGFHTAAGFQYVFFAWAVLPSIIFGSRAQKESVVWMMTSILLFVMSMNGWGLDRWFPGVVVQLKPGVYAWLHAAAGLTSFLILTASVHWLQRAAESNELLLEQTVNRLRREKGRMEILLRGSMDAIFFLRPSMDPETGKRRFIVNGVSRVVSKWVKEQKLRDIIGRPLNDVMMPGLAQALAPLLEGVTGSSRAIEQEFSFEESPVSGSRFFRCALVAFGGEVALSLREITEEVTQKVNMEQMSRLSALGEMAGGVAHEINNPLTIIAMGVDHVLSAPGSEQFHPKLTRVRAAVDRISKIVQGMRTLSRRGEADRPQLVSLDSVIQTTLDVCAERFKYTGIVIERTGNTSVSVLGNPVQLSQVLLNLLNNSRDALEAVDDKWIRIDVSEKDGTASLVVTDSGKGIDVPTQQKLFQPFFTTKKVGKGTGLGLSVSARIMKSHQGELRYDATCGNTRFIMSLPRAEATTATGSSDPAKAA